MITIKDDSPTEQWEYHPNYGIFRTKRYVRIIKVNNAKVLMDEWVTLVKSLDHSTSFSEIVVVNHDNNQNEKPFLLGIRWFGQRLVFKSDGIFNGNVSSRKKLTETLSKLSHKEGNHG